MVAPEPRTAVGLLVELLGKVPDAGTLEILLEPENLHRLLRARGLSDESIREQLTGRARLPGELLLDVLAREPDTRVLLAELGNPEPKATAKRDLGKGSHLGKGPDPLNALAPSARSIARLAVGVLLAAPSGYYLFVRLDVLHVPGLIVYFPGAYALLVTLIVVGVFLIATGVRALLRER